MRKDGIEMVNLGRGFEIRLRMAQGPAWNDVVLAEYVIVGLTPHL